MDFDYNELIQGFSDLGISTADLTYLHRGVSNSESLLPPRLPLSSSKQSRFLSANPVKIGEVDKIGLLDSLKSALKASQSLSPEGLLSKDTIKRKAVRFARINTTCLINHTDTPETVLTSPKYSEKDPFDEIKGTADSGWRLECRNFPLGAPGLSASPVTLLSPSSSSSLPYTSTRRNVMLEKVELNDNLITGTIQVRNLAYCKTVSVRYTFDFWASHTELTASFMHSICTGIDRFGFSIDVGGVINAASNGSSQQMINDDDDLPIIPGLPYCSGKALSICVRYEVASVIYWDNNSGANYSLNLIAPANLDFNLPLHSSSAHRTVSLRKKSSFLPQFVLSESPPIPLAAHEPKYMFNGRYDFFNALVTSAGVEPAIPVPPPKNRRSRTDGSRRPRPKSSPPSSFGQGSFGGGVYADDIQGTWNLRFGGSSTSASMAPLQHASRGAGIGRRGSPSGSSASSLNSLNSLEGAGGLGLSSSPVGIRV